MSEVALQWQREREGVKRRKREREIVSIRVFQWVLNTYKL
jgi:hypothetical protein